MYTLNLHDVILETSLSVAVSIFQIFYSHDNRIPTYICDHLCNIFLLILKIK